MTITAPSTAIGAFASRAEAEQAVRHLLGAAFTPAQLGIVLPDAVAPVATSQSPGPIICWAGTVLRSLPGLEIPQEEIRWYEEALLDGRTLVMVEAGDRHSEAMDVLYSCGGQYMVGYSITPFVSESRGA